MKTSFADRPSQHRSSYGVAARPASDRPASHAAGGYAAGRIGPDRGESSAGEATGLSDLAAMTFGCPKAALNAAAREASQGARHREPISSRTSRSINDSHHAAYEVHFKSNYQDEADLKYCVAIYCQQGWDPKTTKVLVTKMDDTKMDDTKHAPRAKPRESHCGDKEMHTGALRKP